jgi:hypothetical protein
MEGRSHIQRHDRNTLNGPHGSPPDQAEAGSSSMPDRKPSSMGTSSDKAGKVIFPDLWPTALRCEALLASSAVCWMAKICGEIVIRGTDRRR